MLEKKSSDRRIGVWASLQETSDGFALQLTMSVDSWRVWPKDPISSLKDLRKGTELNRNRDMNWVRMLEKKSSDRRIGVWASLQETSDGFALQLTRGRLGFDALNLCDLLLLAVDLDLDVRAILRGHESLSASLKLATTRSASGRASNSAYCVA
ncbi:hypothetical protein [Mycobacterium tuberculosis]|uniref:hypothetical protein n=1 Tax=Mycobacterium tuberculosis TaxID=1773 RepID=UPI00272D0537|nr:hypothetical protein [Mycobacterium tuberculosis]